MVLVSFDNISYFRYRAELVLFYANSIGAESEAIETVSLFIEKFISLNTELFIFPLKY